MKKILSIVIVLLVAVLMALTRPDKQAHKEAMLASIREYVDEELNSRIGIKLFTRIGNDVVVKTAGVLINSQLEIHDYGLFNTSSMTFDGKEQTLSVGVLGHVFTFDKEMLHEKLDPLIKGQSTNGKQEGRQP